MRALFAKRAKELNNERQEDVQYDYAKEKNEQPALAHNEVHWPEILI